MFNKNQAVSPLGEPIPGTANRIAPLSQPPTKQALLLERISREGGVTLDELTLVTGWLPHTVRAAITGLRKRGHDVTRQRVDGLSRYMLGGSDQ